MSKKTLPFSIKYRNALKRWREETGIKMTPNGVLVMKILIEHANSETGLAFPSTETIIKESELSKSAVFKSLTKLEELELIKRHKKTRRMGFKSNSYEILLNEYIELKADLPEPESRPDDDIPF